MIRSEQKVKGFRGLPQDKMPVRVLKKTGLHYSQIAFFFHHAQCCAECTDGPFEILVIMCC